MGRLAVGNPIKGFPAGRSPAPTSYQTKPRRKRSDKRFDSLARLFALDSVVVCHAAISLKLRPRGHPRAACGPPFPCFGLRPRRNGVGFRFLRKARKGLCPFHPYQPFEKRLDRKLSCAGGQAVQPSGRFNRRRAACRAANGTWREILGRGDMAGPKTFLC